MNEKDAVKEGFEKRGDRADSGMNYPEIDDNYVSLKYAKKGTKSENKITGVGIMRRMDKKTTNTR